MNGSPVLIDRRPGMYLIMCSRVTQVEATNEIYEDWPVWLL